MLARAELYFEIDSDAYLKITVGNEGAEPLIMELTYDDRGIIIEQKQFSLRDEKALNEYIVQALQQYGRAAA